MRGAPGPSLLRKLRRRAAPWIAWQTYRRLTLTWAAAITARAGLPSPPAGIKVRLVERCDLERFAEDPVYDISARFLDTLRARAHAAAKLVCLRAAPPVIVERCLADAVVAATPYGDAVGVKVERETVMAREVVICERTGGLFPVGGVMGIGTA